MKEAQSDLWQVWKQLYSPTNAFGFFVDCDCEEEEEEFTQKHYQKGLQKSTHTTTDYPYSQPPVWQ